MASTPVAHRRVDLPTILAGIAAAAGLAWLLAIMAAEPLVRTDFRYVWLAGRLWADGANPYGAEFIARSAAVFGDADKLSVWVYPFSWYLPARLLALLPAEPAFRVWQCVLAAATGLCGCCAYRAAYPAPIRRWLLPLVLVFYACTTTAVSGLLRSGQPAIVAIAGLAVLLIAARTESRRLTILGLVLAAFKPQFGLVAFAAMVSSRQGIVAVVIAALWLAGLSIFVIVSGTFSEQLTALLGSLGGGYQALAVNDSSHLIALPQILFVATGWRVPIGALVLATAILVFAGCWAAGRLTGSNRAGLAMVRVVATILGIAFAIGVHGSDLAVLLLLLPLALRLPVGPRLPALAGYLLLWRPENVVRSLPGLFAHVGPGTIAATLVCLAFALAALTSSRKSPMQRGGERPLNRQMEQMCEADGDGRHQNRQP